MLAHSRLEAFYWGVLIALASTVLIFLATGCTSGLNPKQQAALDLYECRVHALEPYIPTAVVDVGELVRDATNGKVNPGLVLSNLGADRADIDAAVAAWNACAKPVVPTDAGTQSL